MKNKLIILSLVFSFLFSSCNKPKNKESTKESDTTEASIDSGNSGDILPDYLDFTVYASNDFHGQVEQKGNSLGLEKFATFFKEKGEEDNTLLLDQGDTWQGSIYSNINYGNLINDVMAYIHYDARTIGNHDFDWGIDKLVANSHREYNGYTIPVLAANVYDYDFQNKRELDTYHSEIGQKTISYVLENGLKVGVVGVIGQNQITSIMSKYVEDIYFKDHIEVIKEEATNLRNEGCDVVVASCHAGQEELLGNGLEDYVDLVLCGHTHQNESKTENGLHYYQFGCNGQSFGKITLRYDTHNKKVSQVSSQVLDATAINRYVKEVDPHIHEMVNESMFECEQEANLVLANNVTGYFDKEEKAVNVMCKAIYDQAIKEGHDDIILSYCNNARAYLPQKKWTYANIYDSFPFDNNVFIIEVTGKEIRDEVMAYNRVYRNPSFDGNIRLNEKYKIACLDYLVFHTNARRYYDYFPDNKGLYLNTLSKHYRQILREWLIDNGYNNGKLMSADDFDSGLTSFSSNFNIIR